MNETQILDSKILVLEKFQGFKGSLLRLLADETSAQVVLQMLAAYTQTVVGELIQIEASFGTQDFEKLKKSFHKLAGTSELLGFPDPGRRWRTLSQDLGKGQSLGQVETEIQELQTLSQVLKEATNASQP